MITTVAGLCSRHEDGIGSISEGKMKRNNVTGKSKLDYAFTDVPIDQSLMSSQHSFSEYNYETLDPWIGGIHRYVLLHFEHQNDIRIILKVVYAGWP